MLTHGVAMPVLFARIQRNRLTPIVPPTRAVKLSPTYAAAHRRPA